MGTTVQINLVDRSNERTSVRIPVQQLTGATTAVLQAFEDALEALITPLTLLNASGTSMNDTTKWAYTLPTDENAHRETAVRFIMADVNQNQASFSIGGPNLSAFPFTVGDGGDVFAWDSTLASSALNDFVDELTILARHPITGLAMTMVRLELVGRSN